MYWNHEPMWPPQLGEIIATKMRIDLNSEAKSFKTAPYSASQKERGIEFSEMDKQLKAGTIEPVTS